MECFCARFCAKLHIYLFKSQTQYIPTIKRQTYMFHPLIKIIHRFITKIIHVSIKNGTMLYVNVKKLF